MADRIQLKTEVYMLLDGQPQIVQGGSVVDVPTADAYSVNHVSRVAETAGTLNNGKPTSVRNIKTR